jgi:hypothetical protein
VVGDIARSPNHLIKNERLESGGALFAKLVEWPADFLSFAQRRQRILVRFSATRNSPRFFSRLALRHVK